MARIPHENAPGIPLTGIAREERRATDAALLRQADKRFSQIEKSAGDLARANAVIAQGRDLRRHTRFVANTDTLDLRTLRADDAIILLTGAPGDFRLHLAGNFARADFAFIRNNSSGDWNLNVYDPGTETAYRYDNPVTTIVMAKGDSLQMWNITNLIWQAF